MNENSVTLPTGVYIFSIVTSIIAIVILISVLKTQIKQFQIKSDLQRMKVFLTVLIVSLLLANLITLGIGLAYINKPLPADVLSIGASINRFNALITTIALGLVYKFQIGDSQNK